MKMLKSFFSLWCVFAALFSFEAYAEPGDARFLVELSQQEAVGLDIQSATELALPILWKRVVPFADLEKANALKAVTSLILQFKSVKYGVKLVFNPNQVRNYLKRYGITMIPEQPHWNLSITAQGFLDQNEELSRDLLNYGYGISDELGFRLGPRGKKLELLFVPIVDVHGDAKLHVGLQGAFSAELLSQVNVDAEGYAIYQLQNFLNQVLIEIRDAYSLGLPVMAEQSREVLLDIDADHSLATQVMLEQSLRKHPAVITLIPVLLQKSHRQYRVQLRDGDDSWIERWFVNHGLTATLQVGESAVDWQVK